MATVWWRATRVRATVALTVASALGYLWAGRVAAAHLLPPPARTTAPATTRRAQQVSEIARLTRQLAQAQAAPAPAAAPAQAIQLPALPALPPAATTRASAV